MEVKKENRVVKPVFMVLLHLAIAGIVVGILMLVRFFVETNYGADRWGTSYEGSDMFARAYENSWYNTAQLIAARELLGPEEELTEDKIIEMEVPVEGETILLHYRLGDINRWYTKGISTYEKTAAVDEGSHPLNYLPEMNTGQEEAGIQQLMIKWLYEEYSPEDAASIYEIARDRGMNAEEIGQFTEAVREQIMYFGECLAQYHQLGEQLKEDKTRFRYYAEKSDGTVYTNMSGAGSMEEAENEAAALDIFWKWDSGTGAEYYNFEHNGSLQGMLQMLKTNWMSYSRDDGEWTVMTGVDMAYSVPDIFGEQKEEFDRIRPLFSVGCGLSILSVLLYLISFVELTVLAGRKPGSEEIILLGIDRVKTEAAVLLFGILAAVLLLGDYAALMFVGNVVRSEGMEFWMGAAVAAVSAVVSNMGLIGGWLCLTRRIKTGTLWSNSLLAGIGKALRLCWEERSVTLRAAVGYVLFLFTNMFFLGLRDSRAFLLAMIMDAVVGIVLLRSAAQRQRIAEGIARIRDGELEHKISTEDLKGDNRVLAEAINNIGDGLKNAVNKSLKSERLKTDLITNVSHDIKTPLTSIINYVDLMKRENIPDEKVRGYLNILESKSQRLKNLTEDLVEASKVSSGNISLEFINIDFVELVNQTNGEFEEKFAAKELRLVTNLPTEPVYVRADGRRLWRVAENLYNNVAKYAMPGSRVYVDLTAEESSVVFSIKNISEQPLNIRAEDLTERFVRGDVSRSTEGSGLGLSIARSLTELQKGQFEIYLDGDLFRVTISFPRVEE